MAKTRCPFCGGEYALVLNHAQVCSSQKENNLTPDEIRFACLESRWGKHLVSKVFWEEHYIRCQKSFPELHNEFGFNYHDIEFLTDFHGIHRRGVKEASPRRVEKSIITCQERYGAPNPLSKGTTAYLKRNETVRTTYGVANVFQLDSVKAKLEKTMILRFGQRRISNGKAISTARKKFTDKKKSNIADKIRFTRGRWNEERRISYHSSCADTSRRWWGRMTKEERNTQIGKMLAHGFSSSLENKVQAALNELGLTYRRNVFIGGRQFDFQVGNLIIEVNGDYWHANPVRYKPDDIIKYPLPMGLVLASTVWKKDEIKRQLAESHGKAMIYVWESELKRKTHRQIVELLIRKIQEIDDAVEVDKTSSECVKAL